MENGPAVHLFRICSVLVLAITVGVQTSVPARAGSGASKATPDLSAPTPGEPVVPGEFNGDLRDLPQVKVQPRADQPHFPVSGPASQRPAVLHSAASTIQTQLPASSMPSPVLSFAGLDRTSGDGVPANVVGDVGLDYYVQAVDTAVEIFDKAGFSLATFTIDGLWSGVGSTPCNGNNQGDVTVLYDALNDRYIFSDFAWVTTVEAPPYYECFAVSKTGDPISGGWRLYAVRTDDATHPWRPDYPKIGLWPDGIYMSANLTDFTPATCPGAPSAPCFKHVRVWALNRNDMETGATLRSFQFDLGASYFSLLPSNLRGTPPLSGTPNYFVANDLSSWGLDVWKFHVDWSTPAATFTGPTFVTSSAYDPVPALVPEQAGEDLATLGDRLMMQNQYRNIEGTESLWLTHAIGSGGVSGIRWYQLNVTGGTIAGSPVQLGDYLPVDSAHRWLPSLAVDGAGDMAMGYSVSSSAMRPAIRYAGRLQSDPLNSLTQGETELIAGTGSQSGGFGLWDFYSSMSIDPADDCTFWYTNEYYVSTGTIWQTRVGAFRFPSCDSLNTIVFIAGNWMGSYALPPTTSTRQNYFGVDSGPVKVRSTNSVPIVASIRDLWYDSTHITSSIQVMGMPSSLLSTSYYFPAYNDVSLDDQIRFGNVGTAPTIVVVTIAGVVRGYYYLLPSQSQRVAYPGLDSGPVVVQSTGGVPIIASIRDSWSDGTEWTSYSQLMGLPAGQLSSTYVFPAYNNVSLDDQIRFGNVGTAATWVSVTIGGVVQGYYYLLPSQSKRVAYAGVDSGPVVVSSSGNVKIIASIRDAWWTGTRWTCYSQLMGLPAGQLSDTYHFPAYDNVSLDGQLRFGNVGSIATWVTVTIGGVVKGVYYLPPSQSQRVSYATLDDGPVLVQSTGGVPIIASLRDAWFDGTDWTSYAQLMGLPASQLSNSYVFPAYNNVSLDDQVRIGMP
jgi:hypothetical protein